MPSPNILLPTPVLIEGVDSFRDDLLIIGQDNPLIYLENLNVIYTHRPNAVGLIKDTLVDRRLIDADLIGVVSCGANLVSRIIENSELPAVIMSAVELQATVFGREMLAIQHSAVFEKIIHALARKAICTSTELLQLVDSFWKQYCDAGGDEHENLRFFRFGAGLSAEQLWRAVGSVLANDLPKLEPKSFNAKN